MKQKLTAWQAASNYESEHGGGMATIFGFLCQLHPMDDKAKADLEAAWTRYNSIMDEFAALRRIAQ